MTFLTPKFAILEFTQPYANFLVEVSPQEVIDMTVKENFGLRFDANIFEHYGDYFITCLN